MAKNWQHAAGVLWPYLTSAAAEGRTVNYQQLAPLIDTIPLQVGRALGPIQTFCLEEKLPPLTAIVVSKGTGVPGEGFIAWDVDDLNAALEQVFNMNWALSQNPFGAFGEDDTVDGFADAIATTREAAKNVYARVKVRGVAQAIFRQLLMRTQGGACVCCGLSFKSALHAAHIVTWAESSHAERLDPRNGLLLCGNHHRLFDDHVIKILPDYTIKYYDPELRDGPYSETDRMVAALHGRKITVPIRPDWRPLAENLRRRL